jgi:hypothetical protein
MDMMRRVLIVVQNLPVPFDRRVWLKRQALVSAGCRVAIFFRAIDGTKFVFDRHDLRLELCESRFPDALRLPCKAPRTLARRTHKAANHDRAEAIVTVTDDAPRRAHLGRLGRAPVEQDPAWSYQERAHLGMCQRLTAGAGALKRTGS